MKKYDLVFKGLGFNNVKKLSILLGFDVSKQEKKEKEEGRNVKTNKELLDEIETEVELKRPKKKR